MAAVSITKTVQIWEVVIDLLSWLTETEAENLFISTCVTKSSERR